MSDHLSHEHSAQPPMIKSWTYNSLAQGLMFSWFLGLIIGPFLGYFVTGITGWMDLDNWRTWMRLRVGICLGWPLGSALLLGVVMRFADGGKDWRPGKWIGTVVVSLVGLFPAHNAIIDLMHGETIAMRIVHEKNTHEHQTRGLAPSQVYSIRLEDGRSYFVVAETYDRSMVGQHCKVAYLPNTDILLDILPPDRVQP